LSFAIRGYVTAARAKSDFSSLTAAGLTTTIVLQAFIIVGGVTRLIPLTGLTLPFISQGGSSLLASFIAVGLLLKCGNEGTGIGTEMTTNARRPVSSEDGVLGRVALGKRLTGLMVVFSVMFALLVANLTIIMVVQADSYRSLPSNSHTLMRQANRERGTVSTVDGVVLAESVPNGDGTYVRTYPSGDLASHVIGYSSVRFGASGIEGSMAETLQGDEHFSSWNDVLKSYAGIATSGNDVRLTLDSRVQRAAQDALAGYSGACVVLDPTTGAVLALASSPTYDASGFEWMLEQGEGDALYNRATQALYAPGSTFKIVTLATALDNNIASEDTVFESPGSMEIGNASVYNYDRNDLGAITLSEATQWSSNTVFGQLGAKIGPDLLVRSADEFGFDRDVDFEIPLSTSLMPNPSEMTEWETAWAAVGQPVGEHESPAGPQATVMEMALVGAAIANDGTIHKPYLVDSIYDIDGTRLSTTSSSVLSRPLDAPTARRVKDVLETVVDSGTGTGAAIWGVSVAGKTGTAETGNDVDNSWFVGMGPTQDCKAVVAIVLEEGADGNTDAATRANNVLLTALEVQDAL
ncbi:MAG: FtsW/RodA/SpoVE family cell cycle protein, partial [Eggerthellaceae bacterium]|nr:FtsW/RodA/SpoVE family cell cycle protein [Eggerthellaceae bacterium]